MTRFHVTAAPRADFYWLQHRTGCALTTDFNAIKATDAQGRIRGMVGYCNWTHNCVQLHICVESPIAWRALLLPGLRYPFEEVGVGVLLGVIRASNPVSLRFARSVGLVETHRVRDGHAKGDDLVFLELRKEDCRQLLPHPHRRAA